MTKKKLFEMIASKDVEIVHLAMIAVLEMGVEWCKDNIPYFGPARSNIPASLALDTIKTKKVFTKNGLTISCKDGKFDVRFTYQFTVYKMFEGCEVIKLD